jgi:hypothetical protein
MILPKLPLLILWVRIAYRARLIDAQLVLHFF